MCLSYMCIYLELKQFVSSCQILHNVKSGVFVEMLKAKVMLNDVFVLLMIFWIYQSVGCRPVASLDHFLPENLGSADLVEEVQTGSSKIVKVNDYLFLYVSLGYR